MRSLLIPGSMLAAFLAGAALVHCGSSGGASGTGTDGGQGQGSGGGGSGAGAVGAACTAASDCNEAAGVGCCIHPATGTQSGVCTLQATCTGSGGGSAGGGSGAGGALLASAISDCPAGSTPTYQTCVAPSVSVCSGSTFCAVAASMGGGSGSGSKGSGSKGSGGNGSGSNGSGGSSSGGNGSGGSSTSGHSGSSSGCTTCLDVSTASPSFACISFPDSCGGTIECSCGTANKGCEPCPVACIPPSTSTCSSVALPFDAGGADAAGLGEVCCSLGPDAGGFCNLKESVCPSLCDPMGGGPSCSSGKTCCQLIEGNKKAGVCYPGSCPAPRPHDAGAP